MFAEYLVKVGKAPVGSGEQKIYRFPNNFGASVVRGNLSYGGPEQWELAVAKWNDDKWEITYTSGITDDVLGYLDWDEVEEILAKIKELS